MAGKVKNEFSDGDRESLLILGKYYEVAGTTSPHDDTATNPDSDDPLLLSQTITASGGSQAPVSHSIWSALVRVWKLTPRRFSRS